MKRITALLLAVLMLVSIGALTSCGKRTLADIKSSGTLTMYTNAAFPPYEYMDGEDVVGVDIDIAQAIADALGVKLSVQNVKFETILGSIESGKADLGIAGMTVTDERLAQVNFSINYATSKQYIITKEGSGVAKIEDLKGMKIGVQAGTTGDFIMTDETTDKDEAAEKPVGVLFGTGAETLYYNTGTEAAMALTSGKIDAVVIDKLPAENIVANNKGLTTLELVYADGSNTEEQYAICIRKGNDELLAEVNKVLGELIASGKIDEWTVKHTNASVEG